MLLNLCASCFVCSGISGGLITYNKLIEYKNKIKQEQIYEYPNLPNNPMDTNIIVKIPNNLIQKKYYIGTMQLNKLVPIQTIKLCFNTKTLKYVNTNIINVKIKNCVLFPPNIYKNLVLDKKLLSMNKIKILFNNNITSYSFYSNILFSKYNQILSTNIPSYLSEINYDDYKNFDIQLQENLISQGEDVYLIVNPSITTNELCISTISNDIDTILTEKYNYLINEIKMIASFSFVICCSGILIFLADK